MPRLLILCEYPTLLGGERSMLATLPAVDHAGFEVLVAAPVSGPLADALHERGIWHVPLQTHNECGERLPLAMMRSDLIGMFERLAPRLVHANSLSMARIAGPAARNWGVPSIGHLRDIATLSQQAVQDLNSHQQLIAVSDATRQYHVAQGLDPSKCVVAHNGIDLNEFQPRPPTGYLHRELQLPPSIQLIAVIGQLGLRKGTDVALTAASKVATELPDVHWLIVGERTSTKEESRAFEASLRSMALSAPLAGRVHFLGERSDVCSLLAECVLLVHAARQEPLGRVLLESAASGLPVVATNVGGTREIFPTDANGALLVPTNNAGTLAAAVIELLRNVERRHMLAQAGRRRVEQCFNIRQAAARLIEFYQSVLT
jgi:glycosyltransferase involved in cell wall biosynthesis